MVDTFAHHVFASQSFTVKSICTGPINPLEESTAPENGDSLPKEAEAALEDSGRHESFRAWSKWSLSGYRCGR